MEHRQMTGAQSKRDRAKSKTSKWAKVALASQPKRSTNSFPGATVAAKLLKVTMWGCLSLSIYISVCVGVSS